MGRVTTWEGCRSGGGGKGGGGGCVGSFARDAAASDADEGRRSRPRERAAIGGAEGGGGARRALGETRPLRLLGDNRHEETTAGMPAVLTGGEGAGRGARGDDGGGPATQHAAGAVVDMPCEPCHPPTHAGTSVPARVTVMSGEPLNGGGDGTEPHRRQRCVWRCIRPSRVRFRHLPAASLCHSDALFRLRNRFINLCFLRTINKFTDTPNTNTLVKR